MSERSSAASQGNGEEAKPRVDVPAAIRDERRRSEEITLGKRTHPFERSEVSDQGSPHGGGTEDLPGGVSAEDPADPTSPVHPDR